MDTSEQEPKSTALKRVILVILVILAAFFSWVGWEVYIAVTAKPGTRVNYAAQLRDLLGSYQENAAAQDNWVLLGELTVLFVEWNSQYADRVDEQGRPIAPDLDSITTPPKLSEFDPAPEVVIALALEGLADLEQRGAFEIAAEFVDAGAAIRPVPDGLLLYITLPNAGTDRQLARANAARMYLAHQRGEDPAIIPPFEQTLAIARIRSYQGLLIDRLIAIASAQRALKELRHELTERPLDAESLKAALNAIDNQTPFAPLKLTLESEKLGASDILQMIHTDRGRLILTELNKLRGTSGGGGGVGVLPSDWSTYKIINMASLVSPRLDESLEIIDRIYGDAAKASQVAPPLRTFDADQLLLTLPQRYEAVSTVLPALQSFMRQIDRFQLVLDSTRLMLAVELFNATNGQYPDAITDLTPAILAEIPVDYTTGQPFIYKRFAPDEDEHNRPYLLYTTGMDEVDNGGITHARGSHIALENYAAVGVDFVINEPRPKPRTQEDD